MKYRLFGVLALIFSTLTSATPNTQCNQACTFVLTDGNGNELAVIDDTRASTPFTPFSTFKIPNTLIALETGVVTSLTDTYSVDRDRYPEQAWWPQKWREGNLTIRDAFQYSALPLYRAYAEEIGATQMQSFVDRFSYGNRDISSGLDDFWLNASMKISAREQVRFLRELNTHGFDLSQQTLKDFDTIMLVEDTPSYRLYAKTGGGSLAKGRALGWYVGFVERHDGHTFYFALNIEGKSFGEVRHTRIEAVRTLLTHHGVYGTESATSASD